jgi:transcriptional regulatory protein GAL4
VEQRLQKVEALFAELLPDLDLEDLLASSSATSPNPLPTSESIQSVARSTSPTQDGDETFSEALPDDPDGFDWREETAEDNDMADGMASLSIEPNGVGYLGLYRILPFQQF